MRCTPAGRADIYVASAQFNLAYVRYDSSPESVTPLVAGLNKLTASWEMKICNANLWTNSLTTAAKKDENGQTAKGRWGNITT